MTLFTDPILAVLGIVLVLASLGVIFVKKPVHASLLFLLTLMDLAMIYLHLSAEFIAMMQVLVYAGAILVIFMFVIILFQDAHEEVSKFPARSAWPLITTAAVVVLLSLGAFGFKLTTFQSTNQPVPADFGSVNALGHALYVDFFFPFEAVILIFLIAVVGALYIARRAE